jgi:hypothetical protein
VIVKRKKLFSAAVCVVCKKTYFFEFLINVLLSTRSARDTEQ